MNKNRSLIFVGAGGLAKELIGYFREAGLADPLVLLRDFEEGEPAEQDLFGIPVRDIASYDGACRNAVLAVGEPLPKKLVYEKCEGLGLTWVSFLHPTASLSPLARIADGCVVGPFVVVAGDARIDRFCFLNAHAAVGHDVSIGQFSSLMPAAIVAGNARLGSEVLAATGSRILPGVSIGDRCRLAAGATAYRDAPPDHLLDGSPARASPDVFNMRRRMKLRLPD